MPKMWLDKQKPEPGTSSTPSSDKRDAPIMKRIEDMLDAKLTSFKTEMVNIVKEMSCQVTAAAAAAAALTRQLATNLGKMINA